MLNPYANILYESPMPSTRTGPLANAFSYPTKISPESIALFIASHTRPGDTVLDVFGGSGSLGLAALLCDKPTPRMREMAQALGLQPAWGPRKAVVYELSVLGAFVAATMCRPPDAGVFTDAASQLLDDAEAELGWMYHAVDPAGRTGTIRHIIWTEVVECPVCGAQTTFWDAAVREAPLRLADTYACHECGHSARLRECSRATSTNLDPLLGSEVEGRIRRPARVYGVTDGRPWQRPANDDDVQLCSRIQEAPVPDEAPVRSIEWGDLHRSGYHQGITHLHHFYTRRNFSVLSHLWHRTGQFDPDVRDALQLLILSFNATHSTLMTRVVVKSGDHDFALTGAQSGVLYVSGLPVEKNIFLGLRRKIRTLAAAFEQVSGSKSLVDVVNDSSTNLALPDESVDYVFTDPPFGGFIPYAEVNQLNELWLGRVTDKRDEVVISPSQNKTADDYGSLLTSVFSEVSRVLKNSGFATIVFHSARADVWRTLSSALGTSGLQTITTSVLDKAQSSFKQTVSRNGVKGDPLILVSKADRAHFASDIHMQSHVDATFAAAHDSSEAVERTPERMYSRFITRCLETGTPVQLDAAEFYQMVQASCGSSS